MIVTKLVYLLLFLASGPNADEIAVLDYIHAHQDLAVKEMQEHGIPASIKLAQALVESDAGRSVLAVRANNHFGIKCKSWWTGGQYFYADDDVNTAGQLTASCFRIYESAQQSFEDHSAFLASSDRYRPLFGYGSDYHKWANGLQQCGYATNPRYGKRLIQIIDMYRLYELDEASGE